MKKIFILVISVFTIFSCATDDDYCICSNGKECIDNECHCPVGQIDFDDVCFSASDGYYFGDLSSVCLDSTLLKVLPDRNLIELRTQNPENGGSIAMHDVVDGKYHFYQFVNVCSPFSEQHPFDTLETNTLNLEFWVELRGDTAIVDINKLELRDTSRFIMIKPSK